MGPNIQNIHNIHLNNLRWFTLIHNIHSLRTSIGLHIIFIISPRSCMSLGMPNCTSSGSGLRPELCDRTLSPSQRLSSSSPSVELIWLAGRWYGWRRRGRPPSCRVWRRLSFVSWMRRFASLWGCREIHIPYLIRGNWVLKRLTSEVVR